MICTNAQISSLMAAYNVYSQVDVIINQANIALTQERN